MNNGMLHIGQTLRMQSGSVVKEVEVVALTKTYVEVEFIEDGKPRLSILFAEDGRQLGCRGTYGEFMPGLVGTDCGVWVLQEFI